MAFSRDSYATLSEVHCQCTHTHTHTHWNTRTNSAVLVNHIEWHVQMLLLWFRAFPVLNGTDIFTILPRSVDEKGIWEQGNGVRDRCNMAWLLHVALNLGRDGKWYNNPWSYDRFHDEYPKSNREHYTTILYVWDVEGCILKGHRLMFKAVSQLGAVSTRTQPIYQSTNMICLYRHPENLCWYIVVGYDL